MDLTTEIPQTNSGGPGRFLDIHDVEGITQTVTHVSSIISLFGIGCAIDLKEFDRKEAKLSKAISITLLLQTIFLPFIGFFVAVALQLHDKAAMGALVVASSPAASYTSVLSYWAEGNLPLSVCVPVLSTALSIGLMTLWFSLYVGFWTSQFFVVFYPFEAALYLSILIFPVAFGMICKRYLPKVAKKLAKICPLAFLVNIILTSCIIGIYRPWLFSAAGVEIYVSAFLIPFIGYFTGFVMAFILRLPYDVCVASSVALGAANGPLAVTVVFHSFKDNSEFLDQVLTLPTLYMLFAPIEGVIWCMVYRFVDDCFMKWIPSLCDASSVEVEEEDV